MNVLKMAHIIAVAGKGGVGKTVISALLLRFLIEDEDIRRDGVLVIDADPAVSLPFALGLEVKKTIGDIREEIAEPSGIIFDERMPIDMLLEYKINEIMVKRPYFSLIAMGRPEGVGCYCLVNDMLRHFIGKLSSRFGTILIDCEAGLEHLSRRTTQDVDTMLVVSDFTKRGFKTAAAIKSLAESLHIEFKRIFLVINKVPASANVHFEEIERLTGMPIAGVVPEDEIVSKFDYEGKPIFLLPENSKAVLAVRKIFERIFSV
ncbi:MAG: AAA family ATPase [Candidatus Methanospirare jalkutatii]|nr:AAA family ATPase [Candidatus Methanospirare jalkutatii]